MNTKRNLLLTIALIAILLAGCRKKNPDDILTDAQKAFDRGDMIGAIVKAQDLVKKYPDTPAAIGGWFLLARSQAKNGDVQGARASLTEVITRLTLKSEPGQAAFQYRLDTYKNNRGSFDKPQEAINEIIKTSDTLRAAPPQFAQNIQIQLADAYFDNKQPDKAEAHLRTMLQNSRTDEEALPIMEKIVAILLYEKKLPEALAIYQNRLEKSPNSKYKGSLLFGIGAMHLKIAETTKDPAGKATEEKAGHDAMNASEQVFLQQIKSEPIERNKTSLMIQLSHLYRGMGDNNKADAYIEQQIPKATKPEFKFELLTELINYQLEHRNYPKAKHYLIEMTKLFPNQEIGQQAMRAIAKVDSIMKTLATSGTLKTAPLAPTGKSTQTAPSTPELNVTTTATVPNSDKTKEPK